VALLRYRALTRDGTREAGTMEGPTSDAVTSALRSRGLIVLEVTPAGASPGRFYKRASGADLTEFTRAFSALLPAGLPLARALSVARDIVPSAMQAPLADVHTRVERGVALSDAFAAHPDVFPASYVGLVRAGERSGNLNESMRRLADALERDQALRSRLLTAAIYPALLALVGGAAILVLLMVVLPRFGALFASSGSALPTSTAVVLAVSAALRAHVVSVSIVVILFMSFSVWLAVADDAAAGRSRLLLSMPLANRLYREALAARAARLIAILLGGGAPFITALDDAAKSLGDPAAQQEILRVRARVREGSSPAAALAEGSLFPPLLARLVAAGEESSQLESFFSKAADLFEERSTRSAARFMAFAEPGLIVAFGLVVGVIALALVQAIYGINVAPTRALR